MRSRERMPGHIPEEENKPESKKDKRHFLSEQDYELSEKEFMNKYQVSRDTFYRAKKKGYFIPNYHKKSEKSIKDEKKREFNMNRRRELHPETSLEKLISLGIPRTTAQRAIKRGWVYLDDSVHSPEEIQGIFEITQKKKYMISPEDKALSEKEFMDKYQVSRDTYYRAKKKGYFIPDFHKKETIIDNQWLNINKAKLHVSAKKAVWSALKKMGLSVNEIAPYDIEDLVSEGYARLAELSGKTNDRDSEAWQIEVAKRAALQFLRRNVVEIDKNEQPLMDEERFDSD